MPALKSSLQNWLSVSQRSVLKGSQSYVGSSPDVRFRLEAGEDGKPTLYIYDTIVADEFEAEYWGGVTALQVLEEIKKYAGQPIVVRINSVGGESSNGIAIYNALRRHGATVTTIVDGTAASVASIIFLAGDERRMGEGTTLMVHEPRTFFAGNRTALRSVLTALDSLTAAIVDLYADRTKQPKSKIEAWLAAETYMSANEAVKNGFADSVEKPPEKEKTSTNLEGERIDDKRASITQDPLAPNPPNRMLIKATAIRKQRLEARRAS